MNLVFSEGQFIPKFHLAYSHVLDSRSIVTPVQFTEVLKPGERLKNGWHVMYFLPLSGCFFSFVLLAKATLTALDKQLVVRAAKKEQRDSPAATNINQPAALDSVSEPSKPDVTPKPEPTEEGPKVELSPEQNRVFTKVKEGKNVFFTGSAGELSPPLSDLVLKLLRHGKIGAFTRNNQVTKGSRFTDRCNCVDWDSSSQHWRCHFALMGRNWTGN